MKKSTTKSLKTKLWKLVSEYVRKSEADWRGLTECYTCGARKPWTEMNAGHFKHNTLDFDLRNLKPQCPQCNLFKHGKLDVYGVRLVKEHGLAWVKKLEKDSIEKGNNYSLEELQKLLITFKTKICNLK